MNTNSEDPNVRRTPEEEPVPDQGLPPRLRERLEARDRRSNAGARGGGVGLTLLVLLLLVAAGGLIWWRSYQSGNNIAARGTNGQPASAVPDVTNKAFGVSVGHFPSEDAAIGERDRLTNATHLPVSVGQSNGSDGAIEFRVILGSYSTRAEAESAGRTLQQQSIVKDWQVVPLSQSTM
jgi:hypothetical protein